MNKTRDLRIDIVKGIGIALMVLGHANAPGTRFFYLFHMAIFFMATGYLFKDAHTDNLKNLGKYIWRRVLTLWLPYVLADTIYNLLNNFFKAVHIYAGSALKEELSWGGMLMVMPARTLTWADIAQRFLNALRFQGSAEFGMALWFLQALFGVTILFAVIDWVLKKLLNALVKGDERANIRRYIAEVLMGILAVVFLYLGYRISKTHSVNLHGFEKSLTSFILLYLGRLIHRYLQKPIFDKKVVSVILGAAACIGLIVANSHGRIELSANQITSPAFFVAVSVLGWIFVYGIATILSPVEKIRQIFIVLGQNTLAIVILHFLAFRIVSAIIVACYGLPIDAIAATPIITGHGAWWLAYSVVGLAVPATVNEGKKRLIAAVRKKKAAEKNANR